MLQVREAEADGMSDGIIVTTDLANCPGCGALAVKLGLNQRQCNTCGLTWTLQTEADELDQAADRAVRSRGYAEKQGRTAAISKHQTRW